MKVYVGGLSYGTTADGLRAKFSEIGEVQDAIVIVDRETKRSRGFGFVTFCEADSAEAAIAKLNGNQLEGRAIRVDRASDSRGGGGGGDRPRGGYGGGSGGYDNNAGGGYRQQRGSYGQSDRQGGGGYNNRGGDYGGGERRFGGNGGGAYASGEGSGGEGGRNYAGARNRDRSY